MRFFKILSLFLAIAMLTSCGSIEGVLPEDEPAHIINADAQSLLARGEHKDAANRFLELERQHPYSKFTQKGMMLAIESYFLIRDYDDVAYTADRYIILYPKASDVKRAYYLRAEAYYIRVADVKRAQRQAQTIQ